MNAEKNDVDISKLFNWGKEFEITDNVGKVIAKVYIRLVGDAELNQSRVKALRNSAQLRKSLRTQGSDENLAYIPDLDSIDSHNIIEVILNNEVSSITREVMYSLDIPLPKEPRSDSSIEEQEKYQEEVDKYPAKRNKILLDRVNKQLDKKRKEYSTKTKEELYKILTNIIIDKLCEEHMMKSFKEWCTYFGTYKDKDFKYRLCKTFDEFSNLAPEFKEQLINGYDSLDLVSDDLKKLPEATQ
jgi:hypothetical protein